MSERTKDAATRAAIVALSVYLAGVATSRVPIRPLLSARTIAFAVFFVAAWVLVTLWQIRSRVERWGWGALYLGFILSFVASAMTFALAVRLYAFLRFGR